MNSGLLRASALACAVVGLMLGLPAGASAQPAPPGPSRGVTGIGYGFGAVGGVEGDPTLHIGGGGEAIFRDTIGVGAEIGYLGPFDGFGDGLGVFSVNGSYHFPSGTSRKLKPFVTGGYTLAFREGTANLFNFGGGVDYWFGPKVGLRVEFRDHVWTGEGGLHAWGFRVGIVWK